MSEGYCPPGLCDGGEPGELCGDGTAVHTGELMWTCTNAANRWLACEHPERPWDWAIAYHVDRVCRACLFVARLDAKLHDRLGAEAGVPFLSRRMVADYVAYRQQQAGR